MELHGLTEEEKAIYLVEDMLKHQIHDLMIFAYLEQNGQIECDDPEDLDIHMEALVKTQQKYDAHRLKYEKYFPKSC